MDGKVLDRAVEAGERGLLAFREQLAAELSRGDESSFRGTNDEIRQRNVRVVVEAAVPVIVAAAVKEEREKARKLLLSKNVRADAWTRYHRYTHPVTGDPISVLEWGDAVDAIIDLALEAALAAIDKEGEGE